MLTNSIHRTKIVSFPRSGHHLLIRGLQAVFESELVYSEFYRSKHNMENCPFVNVQKSHDFDLDEQIDPELKYVVLLRQSHEAIPSWYKQSVTYEGYIPSSADFFVEKTDYYNRFQDKWQSLESENVLFVFFSILVADKLTNLLRVCNFISTKPLTPYQIIAAKAWEKRESFGY